MTHGEINVKVVTMCLGLEAYFYFVQKKLQRNRQRCIQTGYHQTWFRKWKLKVNEAKSIHVTFALKRDICPPVALYGVTTPQVEYTKYLGMHLDKTLTWRKHIFTKRKQLGLKFWQMYWLLGQHSRLALDSKLILYKTILKPIWT
jgi:hypothetical protein